MGYRYGGGRVLALVGITLATLGCARSDGLNLGKVRGRVVVDGEPAKHGFVVFEPDRSKGGGGSTSMGPIQEDGTYLITSRDPGDGASIGPNQVGILVLGREPVDAAAKKKAVNEVAAAKGQAARPSKSKEGRPTFTARDGRLYEILTPEPMKDPGKSGIVVEVESGSNTFDFSFGPDGTVKVGP